MSDMSGMSGLSTVFLLFLVSCATAPRPGEELVRSGDEIVVDGRFVHTGTRVVTWLDPGGYDAYRPHRRSDPEITGPEDAPDRIARFGSVRRGRPRDVAAAVSQIVVHYDACGTSVRCFTVLHVRRGLSCHFLLDLDGTVYQTLDVKERAWHAGVANDRSVGIEIANIGAYPDRETPEAWYAPGGGHPAGAPPPAQPGIVTGRVQGQDLFQYDFTRPQYEALASLVATLCRVLDVPASTPRGAAGRVRTEALPEADAVAFPGIVGHLHVSASKVDPGPAFDWERFLADVRRRLAE